MKSPEEMELRLRVIHKATRCIGIADTYVRTAAALLSDLDDEVAPFEWEEEILAAVKKHLLKTADPEHEDLLDFLRSILKLGDGVAETTTQLQQVTYQLAVARHENERLRKALEEKKQ